MIFSINPARTIQSSGVRTPAQPSRRDCGPAHKRKRAVLYRAVTSCRQEKGSKRGETDPEFSFAPALKNVMKIYGFLRRVSALKTMPATWQDPFFPEVHGLQGNSG